MRLVVVLVIICFGVVQALGANSTIPAAQHPSLLARGPTLGNLVFDCGSNGSASCSISDFMKDSRVCALLVIKVGQIRLEKYAEDPALCRDDDAALNGPRKLYGVASVTKSITSTLLGAAIAEKFHPRNERELLAILARPIRSFVPSIALKPPSAYADVPLDRVLRMRSGVRWSEWGWHGYFSDNGRLVNDVRVKGRYSVAEFARRYRDLVGTQPAPFGYSGLDGAVAALTAEEIVGEKLPVFAGRKLWMRIGAESNAKWGVDKTGTGMGNCCFKATVRDLGRFGLLVLNRGTDPHRERLIPAAWFDLATKRGSGTDDVIPKNNPSQNHACRMNYRYFWWLRQNRTDFSAVGTDGQFIHIYPKEGVVIVQISDWNGWTDGNRRECESFQAHDALVRALN